MGVPPKSMVYIALCREVRVSLLLSGQYDRPGQPKLKAQKRFQANLKPSAQGNARAKSLANLNGLPRSAKRDLTREAVRGDQ